MEHDAGGLHVFYGGLECRCPGPICDFRVPGGINHALCKNCFAARLGFHDDANYGVSLHDRCDELPMQHGVNSGLLDQPVGDKLKSFAIQLVAQRLAFWNIRAHGLGTLFEFPTYAARLDRGLVAIPCETFHTDNGYVAAEAAEPFQQTSLRRLNVLPQVRQQVRRDQIRRPAHLFDGRQVFDVPVR